MVISKNIVILGAGFGGLRAAMDIDSGLNKYEIKDYKIILIDKSPYHAFTPLLYKVASVHKKFFKLETLRNLTAFSIAELTKNTGIKFKNDEITDIDLHERNIKLKSENIPFEYLVISLGSEVVHFNIPGLKENAFNLKTFEDAFGLRSRFENLIQELNGGKNIRIIIGGGGSTGVELAAETARLMRAHKEKLEIIILEATPTILPGFDNRIVEKIHKRLEHLGIKIMPNKPVASLTFKEVKLKDGMVIPYDLFIWTGGVGANNLTEQVSQHLKKGEKNRLEISSDLICKPKDLNSPTYGFVYAIGDMACILDPQSKKMVPLVARAAIEEGKIVAKNIIKRLRFKNKKERGGKNLSHYIPDEYPYIIPVGGKFAVAKIGSIIISGFLGWVFKTLVEFNYFRTIMPLWSAKKIWLKSLRIFSAND